MWLSINGPWQRLALAFALALGVGCGQVSNDPNGIASRPSTRGGAGGAAGGSSRAGTGGEADEGEGGRGGAPALSADAGGLDLDDDDSEPSPVGGWDPPLPEDCPEIEPIPAPGQVIVIQSVNFETYEVVLKNVSDETQVILGGRQGWQWCQFPAYWTIYEAADVELSPGETFAFTLIYGTTPRELDPEGGELGIYTTTGSFTTASLMRAFVSWGNVSSQREPTAVQAGYWVFNERIQLEPGDAGFVLTGRADAAASYQPVRRACLRAPANE